MYTITLYCTASGLASPQAGPAPAATPAVPLPSVQPPPAPSGNPASPLGGPQATPGNDPALTPSAPSASPGAPSQKSVLESKVARLDADFAKQQRLMDDLRYELSVIKATVLKYSRDLTKHELTPEKRGKLDQKAFDEYTGKRLYLKDLMKKHKADAAAIAAKWNAAKRMRKGLEAQLSQAEAELAALPDPDEKWWEAFTLADDGSNYISPYV